MKQFLTFGPSVRGRTSV